MRATPSGTSCAGCDGSGWPSSCTWPALAARVPHSSSANATWPLPETPAIATISPACRLRLACSRRSRAGAVLTSSSTHTALPTAWAGRRCGASTAWPTIHSASCAWLVSAASAWATSRPARNTAMRCDTRITSPSLWLMKMIDRPCATIWPSTSNRASLSCGVSTAVGSSKIRMRAPRYSAFRISTRWRSPTDSRPTSASGSTPRPKRCATACSRARAVLRRVKGCHSGSEPSITLSSTLRLSANVKCWCTMPMPAASAAFGSPGGSGRPNTVMLPASAV